MLKFAQDMIECRKILFAKYVSRNFRFRYKLFDTIRTQLFLDFIIFVSFGLVRLGGQQAHALWPL